MNRLYHATYAKAVEAATAEYGETWTHTVAIKLTAWGWRLCGQGVRA